MAAPQVMAQLLDDSWGDRYAARIDTWRMPAATTRKDELALAYGRDGHTLLKAVYTAAASDPDLAFLARLQQVEVLRVVLVQNYLIVIDERGREVIRRREAQVEGLPPGRSRITSPYDTDARWGVQRDTFWNGYKTHVTETCDTTRAAGDSDEEGAAITPPHLIVNVETTDATVPDSQMTEPIHTHLDQRGLLPGEHLVDSGYPSAELLASSQADYGITLVTPMLADTSPQARAGAGFDRTAFTIDFDARHATCPHAHTSSSWNPATQRGTPTIVITFSKADCGPCPVRELCPTSASQRRQLTVHPRQVHQAQLAARAAADTKDFQARYALRAGVEGTVRQGVAVTGMRHARYRGLDKTRMEHTYAAVALNLIRLDAWWNGHPLTGPAPATSPSSKPNRPHETRINHQGRNYGKALQRDPRELAFTFPRPEVRPLVLSVLSLGSSTGHATAVPTGRSAARACPPHSGPEGCTPARSVRLAVAGSSSRPSQPPTRPRPRRRSCAKPRPRCPSRPPVRRRPPRAARPPARLTAAR